MTGDDRTETVASELELADEELRAADHLLAVGIPRVALARTYFAVFHAARARLYADGLEPRTHSGVAARALVEHVRNDVS